MYMIETVFVQTKAFILVNIYSCISFNLYKFLLASISKIKTTRESESVLEAISLDIIRNGRVVICIIDRASGPLKSALLASCR